MTFTKARELVQDYLLLIVGCPIMLMTGYKYSKCIIIIIIQEVQLLYCTYVIGD